MVNANKRVRLFTWRVHVGCLAAASAHGPVALFANPDVPLALRLRRSERRLQARAAFGVGTKVTAPWFASPDLAQCTTTLRRFAHFLQLARTLCICSALRLWIFGLAEIGFSNSLGAFPLRSSRGGGIAPPLQHIDCGDRTKRRRPPSSTRDLIYSFFGSYVTPRLRLPRSRSMYSRPRLPGTAPHADSQFLVIEPTELTARAAADGSAVVVV